MAAGRFGNETVSSALYLESEIADIVTVCYVKKSI